MKKLLFLLALIMNIFCISASAENIGIVINGDELKTDNSPIMINDRVLVPVRTIFEELDARVEWDRKNYCVMARKNGIAIKIPIGEDALFAGIINSDDVMIFSSKIPVDVPAQIISDRTYVPIRVVSEAFNLEVSWDGEVQNVIIKTPQEGENKIFYSSLDDYGKLFSIDSNGTERKKISDRSVKEVYYDNGMLYYITYDGYLFSCDENGKGEIQLTDFDTEVISIENNRIFVYSKDNKILYEINNSIIEIDEVLNPYKYNNYIYYNRENSVSMFALNIDTYTETAVTMGNNVILSPYNCVFYGDYILVEDGEWYNNIFRFNADGAKKTAITHVNSMICRNQEYDARVLYVNGDKGQDIYYTWIDGSFDARIVDMPENCVYADVLAQKGDMIFYKNMYRKEIYRTDFDATENIYVAYGDDIKIFDDIMLIDNDGLYSSALNGGNLKKLTDRSIEEYFLFNSNIFGKDKEYRNIIKIDFDGNIVNLTKDCVLSWTINI